jgi:hypothetical protein
MLAAYRGDSVIQFARVAALAAVPLTDPGSSRRCTPVRVGVAVEPVRSSATSPRQAAAIRASAAASNGTGNVAYSSGQRTGAARFTRMWTGSAGGAAQEPAVGPLRQPGRFPCTFTPGSVTAPG